MQEKYFSHMPSEQKEKQNNKKEIELHLNDIITNRRKNLRNMPDTEKLPELDESSLNELKENEVSQVIKNLELLKHLNGHKGAALTDLVKKRTTHQTAYLDELMRWSIQAAKKNDYRPGIIDRSNAANYEEIFGKP